MKALAIAHILRRVGRLAIIGGIGGAASTVGVVGPETVLQHVTEPGMWTPDAIIAIVSALSALAGAIAEAVAKVIEATKKPV